MKSIEISIPCRRFAAQVVLGDAAGLSEFEQFLVRAIALGANSVEAASGCLRLDVSLVLDACIDLLRAGLLEVAPIDGTLALTPAVRDALGDPVRPRENWAAQLEGATVPEAREIMLLQELVGGGVISSRRDGRSLRSSLRAPENEMLPLVRDIQKPQLITAASALLRSRLKEDAASTGPKRDLAWAVQRRRLVDVRIAMGAAEPDTARDFIVVEIVRWRTDEEAPDLRVIGPRSLPGSIRQGIARGLRDLWDRGLAQEKDQFFGRLLKELDAVERDVESNDVGMSDPFLAMEQLDAKIGEAAGAVASTGDDLGRRHTEIEVLARTCRDDIDDALTHRAHPELVTDNARLHDLVTEAVAQAKDQVILTSPWIGRLERDARLGDALVEAVARGVKVHLLWGIDRAKTIAEVLSPAAQQVVEALKPGGGLGGLFISDRAAAIHAKLVICDLDWMLVSTSNVLNNSRDRTEFELGVLVRGIDSGSDPQATAEPGSARPIIARALRTAVRWSRSVQPDYRMRSLIVDDPVLNGMQALAIPADLDIPLSAPTYPTLWLNDWRKAAQTLRSKLAGSGPIVQPVPNAQNRWLLLHAIDNARRRLTVSSLTLGDAFVSPTIAGDVVRAARRGVEIVVVHSTVEHDDIGPRRAFLEEAGVRFERRNVHAKAIVCDDWAAISSFNFLSFHGFYDSERRARHEFGVRVIDADFADRVHAAILDAPPR